MSLKESWSKISAAAHDNRQVLAPMPRLWNEHREKQARKIDEALRLMNAGWHDLERAVRLASNGGAECRLDLSLERLTSKQCERLDSLMSGRWTDQKRLNAERRADAEARARAKKDAERKAEEKRAPRPVPDNERREFLARVRNEVGL